MTEELRGHALLVESLGSALRSGNHGLQTVPGLLKQVLAEESWRDFVTKRGEHVTHDRFADFVATPPLKGLGASMETIMRIVGTSDPELLKLLREASKAGPGGRPRTGAESAPVRHVGNGASDYLAERLEQMAPEEYQAVLRGERTINAAAVRAGLRPRRVNIRLDNPESAAETLRKHMTPDQIRELRKLLDE